MKNDLQWLDDAVRNCFPLFSETCVVTSRCSLLKRGRSVTLIAFEGSPPPAEEGFRRVYFGNGYVVDEEMKK